MCEKESIEIPEHEANNEQPDINPDDPYTAERIRQLIAVDPKAAQVAAVRRRRINKMIRRFVSSVNLLI